MRITQEYLIRKQLRISKKKNSKIFMLTDIDKQDVDWLAFVRKNRKDKK